jgi:hypothetical protein
MARSTPRACSGWRKTALKIEWCGFGIIREPTVEARRDEGKLDGGQPRGQWIGAITGFFAAFAIGPGAPRRQVGLWPVSCLAMMRRWICPVPSKMS